MKHNQTLWPGGQDLLVKQHRGSPQRVSRGWHQIPFLVGSRHPNERTTRVYRPGSAEMFWRCGDANRRWIAMLLTSGRREAGPVVCSLSPKRHYVFGTRVF